MELRAKFEGKRVENLQAITDGICGPNSECTLALKSGTTNRRRSQLVNLYGLLRFFDDQSCPPAQMLPVIEPGETSKYPWAVEHFILGIVPSSHYLQKRRHLR